MNTRTRESKVSAERRAAGLDQRAAASLRVGRSVATYVTVVGFLLGSTALSAWADGGKGGDSGGNIGGAGGAGFTGNPGATVLTTAGGGGGGAGGGAGGGSLAGGAGGNGGNNGNGAGAASITNASPLAGVDGSQGASGGVNGGGGGGGAGGYGAIVTGGGASSNSSTIAGGKGGAGGASGSSLNDHGGNGGDGGVGIQFTTSGVVFTNSASSIVTGGNGGAGGAAAGAGIAGTPGAGGVGIIGSGLTIFNSGNISGGVSGDSATRANAITFTGGSNVLELQPGSTIFGNVVDQTSAGTLRLGGAINTTGSFDASSIGPAAQYQGFSTFIKTGGSTWSLTGSTAALTPWTINQGILAIQSDGSLGATAGGLTIDGGTLQFLGPTTSTRAVTLNAGGGTFSTLSTNVTLGGSISGPGSLTKTGAGIVTLSGVSSYLGTTTVDQGTLQAGAINAFAPTSAFTIKSTAVLDLNSFDQTVGSIAGAGNVTLGSATLTTGGDGTSTALSGAISGTGGLTKEGIGTFTLSGANAYAGATTVNAGTLQAGAANTFASNSAFTIGPVGTLDLNGFSQSIGSLAGSGAVTLGAGTLTTGNDNTNTTFSGGISGAGGLTKVGSGIFTLSTPATYGGATNVNVGTLQAGAINVFAPNSAFTIASGATLDLNSFDQSIASLAGAGSVTLGAGTLTAGSGNTNTTFSGDISGGGGLTKVGTGSLTLSGTSIYTGATNINAGAVVVDGSIASSPFL